MVSGPATIVWFRQDLRLADNPALHTALKGEGIVIPVYIWAPEEEAKWPLGGASKWWLHHSLETLYSNLEEIGLHLTILKGDSEEQLKALTQSTKAKAIFWNRRYEPWALKREGHLKTAFKKEGIEVQTFNASLLFEPWIIANKQGKPYQVFTPFYNQCLLQGGIEEPLPKPKAGKGKKIAGVSLKELDLMPHTPWDTGIAATWEPGEKGGWKRAKEFIQEPILHYTEQRDRPDLQGTSRLSPHLHFGEVSPRQLWKMIASRGGGEPYLRQLIWREFAYHLLYHFPMTPEHPLRKEFSDFPWVYDADMLEAWQKGMTGYPIVDAGMRQLWNTGWMHNRVRMIVGSFLVKDLRLHWLEGARWFWDTLVDADMANNTLGWQWIAGCGADAAPYFRIFNPVIQGEKFDPKGDYVRRYVPELKKLPSRWVHTPWKAPRELLQECGIKLGETYPEPLVEHAQARDAALKAFSKIR